MKQELKEISLEKIYPNFYQPREKFDKEQIQELASSILSNGLINPISVRVWKGNKFMIVAGERRWRAHKIAGLKTIQAVVKEYKNDSEWMIESLIENLQRENLTSIERENYITKIWKIGKFQSYGELAKQLGVNEENIRQNIKANEIRKDLPKQASENISTRTLLDTQRLEKKEKIELLTKISKGDIQQTDSNTIRNYSRVLEVSPKDVKEALFNDRINVQQAQRISKLSSEKERERAIKQHSAIKNVEQNVERNIKNQTDNQAKRSWDKRLVETKNWLNGFKYAVTEHRQSAEKCFKILMIATKFLPVMDDNQKEKLNDDLDRFLETLEKSKQIADKIQGYVEK